MKLVDRAHRKRARLTAAPMVLAALAVGCGEAQAPSPVPAQSGRWESSDGAYWIEVSDDLRTFAGRLPEKRLGEPSCADPTENGVSGSGLIGMAFATGTDSWLPYAFDDESDNLLHLPTTGDFSVLLAYPCGMDHDPVELILTDSEPDGSDPLSTKRTP